MSRILKVLDNLEQEKSARPPTTGSDQNWNLPAARAPLALPKRPFAHWRLAWVWGLAMMSIVAVMVWYASSQPGSGLGPPLAGEPLPAKIDETPEFVVASPRYVKPPAVPSFSATNSEDAPIRHGSDENANSLEFTRVDPQRIRLQAIAWSPVALDRRAVINEEIVCEGETIAGLSIVAINLDDVVFNQQGRLFKALLGR